MKSELISRKALIIIFALLSIIITASGFYLYVYRKTALKEKEYENLSGIAELKLSQLRQWRMDLLSEGLLFSRIKIFTAAMEDFVVNRGSSEYVFNRMQAEKDIKGFSACGIFDKNYKLVYSDSAFHLDSLLIPRDLFSKQEPELSTIIPGSSTGSYLINLYIPIINRGREIAVIVLQQNPEHFIFPVIQSWPTPSKTSETLIFTIEGDSLVYLNQLRHSDKKPFTFRLSVKDPDLPAAMLARGITGIVEGIDYRGHLVLADLKKVPGTDWYLVTKVDQNELFASLKEQLIAVIVIISVFVAALAFAGLFLWNQQNKKILERLYSSESAQKMLLEKSLRDKEFLIKEVHHRVKNNLQVISSILNLQSGLLKDKSLTNILDEINKRINVFAIVHEKFYSGRLEVVNTSDYLTDLVTLIKDTYYNPAVRVNLQVDPVNLKLEKAIYLGLIINEVISNAYKHAFHNSEDPVIEIKLQSGDDSYMLLKIKDNGSGLVKNYREGGLGKLLIENLTEQMEGEYEINVNEGTEYVFKFRDL